MIEAGAEILLGELGGGVSCHWDAYDLAAWVYRAMVPLDRKRNRVLSRNLPRLAQSTVERKGFERPLYETGALRDSIEHVVMREGNEVVGYVGTNDPIAKYHEFGTSRIPARPFLSAAAMRQEDKIHAMIQRTMAGMLSSGGPNYREMRELLHMAHMLYEKGKEAAEDFLDEDEQ